MPIKNITKLHTQQDQYIRTKVKETTDYKTLKETTMKQQQVEETD